MQTEPISKITNEKKDKALVRSKKDVLFVSNWNLIQNEGKL